MANRRIEIQLQGSSNLGAIGASVGDLRRELNQLERADKRADSQAAKSTATIADRARRIGERTNQLQAGGVSDPLAGGLQAADLAEPLRDAKRELDGLVRAQNRSVQAAERATQATTERRRELQRLSREVERQNATETLSRARQIALEAEADTGDRLARTELARQAIAQRYTAQRLELSRIAKSELVTVSQRNAAQRELVRLTQLEQKELRQIRRESSAIGRLRGSVRRSIGGVGLGLGVGGGGLAAIAGTAVTVAGLRASLRAASDAEESASKFGVVFGEQAERVRKQLESMAGEINRSGYALAGYAAQIQDTFVPMGIARDEAAGLSVQVVQLAEDLASFNNLNTAEVVDRLTGALIGNHENVRIFGSVINESRLKAELAAAGVDQLTGAALEQQKVLARLRLILQDTTDAHGDAARTAGSYANTIKGLQASIGDLAVEMGQIAAGPATSFAAALRSEIDVITELIARQNDLRKARAEAAGVKAGDPESTLGSTAQAAFETVRQSGFLSGVFSPIFDRQDAELQEQNALENAKSIKTIAEQRRAIEARNRLAAEAATGAFTDQETATTQTGRQFLVREATELSQASTDTAFQARVAELTAQIQELEGQVDTDHFAAGELLVAARDLQREITQVESRNTQRIEQATQQLEALTQVEGEFGEGTIAELRRRITEAGITGDTSTLADDLAGDIGSLQQRVNTLLGQTGQAATDELNQLAEALAADTVHAPDALRELNEAATALDAAANLRVDQLRNFLHEASASLKPGQRRGQLAGPDGATPDTPDATTDPKRSASTALREFRTAATVRELELSVAEMRARLAGDTAEQARIQADIASLRTRVEQAGAETAAERALIGQRQQLEGDLAARELVRNAEQFVLRQKAEAGDKDAQDQLNVRRIRDQFGEQRKALQAALANVTDVALGDNLKQQLAALRVAEFDAIQQQFQVQGFGDEQAGDRPQDTPKTAPVIEAGQQFLGLAAIAKASRDAGNNPNQRLEQIGQQQLQQQREHLDAVRELAAGIRAGTAQVVAL